MNAPAKKFVAAGHPHQHAGRVRYPFERRVGCAVLLAIAFQFVAALTAVAAPGTATLTNFTMNPGGRYEFELNSATATPGNGADFLNILETLSVSAGTTPNSVFTIAIISLNSSDAQAPLSNFDATRAYRYTIATAGTGITGFKPEKFAIDASKFQNSLQGGSFSLLQSSDGHSLILQFRPAVTLPLAVTNITLDTTSMPGSIRATLTWNAIVGLTYRIQKKADLATGTWTDDSATYEAISTLPMATSFYTTPWPNAQFYRVIEVSP